MSYHRNKGGQSTIRTECRTLDEALYLINQRNKTVRKSHAAARHNKGWTKERAKPPVSLAPVSIQKIDLGD